MAPRAHWKGYLKLSLVTCPISLYPAVTAAEKVSFRQINSETGHRLRQQLVDSVTGDVVERDKTGRGYQVAEDQFVSVNDEELADARQEARTRAFSRPATNAGSPEPEEPRSTSLKLVGTRQQEEPPAAGVSPPAAPRPILENTRTIELDRFIPRAQIDPRYFSTPYYIAPRDEVGLEAFAVIRDAMADQGLVGMGRIVLANRERPLFIEPMGLGLRGVTLRYAHEVREAEEYFADIPTIELPDDIVQVTAQILNMKREDFDVAYLEDRYRTVLVEKLKEKQALAQPKSAAPAPSAKNVINLMDALKRSLAEQKPPASSQPRKKSIAKRPTAVAAPAKPTRK